MKKIVLLLVVCILFMTGCNDTTQNANHNENSKVDKESSLLKLSDHSHDRKSYSDYYDTNSTYVYLVGSVIKDSIVDVEKTALTEKKEYYYLFKSEQGDIFAIHTKTDSLPCKEGWTCPGKTFKLYGEIKGNYTYNNAQYKVIENSYWVTNYSSFEENKLKDMMKEYVNNINQEYTHETFIWEEGFYEESDGLETHVRNSSNTINIVIKIVDDYNIKEVEIRYEYDYTNVDDIDFDCLYAIINNGIKISKNELLSMRNKVFKSQCPPFSSSINEGEDYKYKNYNINFNCNKDEYIKKNYNKITFEIVK